MHVLLDTGILDTASLVLGLLSWMFAAGALFCGRRMSPDQCGVYAMLSGLTCAAAVWLILYDVDLMLRRPDPGDLVGMARTRVLVAGIILSGALLLNILAWLFNRLRHRRHR